MTTHNSQLSLQDAIDEIHDLKKALDIALKEIAELRHIILKKDEEIVQLKDEIKRLSKQNRRPKIPPPKLNQPKLLRTNQKTPRKPSKKKQDLPTKVQVIMPQNVPDGSRFKGYKSYFVQDLLVEAHQIHFKLGRFITPEGKYITAELPQEFSYKHFGPMTIAYCLHQYYGCHVTRDDLVAQLNDFGMDISAAKLNEILIEHKDFFHAEKNELFRAGLTISDYIQTDDTGARHCGENGFCNVITSPFFTHFESTQSKSRINFLKILRGENDDYLFSEDAFMYLFEKGLCDTAMDKLQQYQGKRIVGDKKLERFLGKFKEKDRRILTEGALFGSVIEQGLRPDMELISDGAGQFNLLVHALCWVHEERHYRKLIPVNDEEKALIETIRDQIWKFYQKLKDYKNDLRIDSQRILENEFDEIFGQDTSWEELNLLLSRTQSRKEGLLRGLDYPWIPLHNNESEREIREYVKKRKISGGTRSFLGRKCRDTFMSLKKTCIKNQISFWKYLYDRIFHWNQIEHLAAYIQRRAREGPIPSY
jgi:Transposase IS66 family